MKSKSTKSVKYYVAGRDGEISQRDILDCICDIDCSHAGPILSHVVSAEVKEMTEVLSEDVGDKDTDYIDVFEVTVTKVKRVAVTVEKTVKVTLAEVKA